MKTKTVLRSLFLAYGLTGVCLLFLAFLVFQFDLGLAPVSAGCNLLSGRGLYGIKNHAKG